jgi:hypothetical protein
MQALNQQMQSMYDQQLAAQQAYAQQLAAQQAYAQRLAAQQAYAQRLAAQREYERQQEEDRLARRLAEDRLALDQATQQAEDRDVIPTIKTRRSTIPSNTIPRYTGPGVTLLNPDDIGEAVNYEIDGRPYTLKPGKSQTLKTRPSYQIEFDHGGTNGQARYKLPEGTYRFVISDEKGWDLRKVR